MHTHKFLGRGQRIMTTAHGKGVLAGFIDFPFDSSAHQNSDLPNLDSVVLH
jgi:hypothetical protein